MLLDITLEAKKNRDWTAYTKRDSHVVQFRWTEEHIEILFRDRKQYVYKLNDFKGKEYLFLCIKILALSGQNLYRFMRDNRLPRHFILEKPIESEEFTEDDIPF